MDALGISGLALLAQIINFVIILYLLNRLAVGPITRILAERRARIEQGIKDAEQARADRADAEQQRAATLNEARREANDIINRAQKVAQETRDADIAATREELERLRVRATEEIEAEKARALADLRSEVADLALAAAGKLVRETMTDDRQRRLVDEFLATAGTRGAGDGSK
jgi:F-type H+-transporting ATPase subunit b